MIQETLLDEVFGTAISSLFGNMYILSLLICLIVLVVLLMNNVSFGVSLMFVLPIFFMANIIGLLGDYSWVLYATITAMAVIYGFIMIRILS